MSQLVEQRTLGFSLGCGLGVIGWSPAWGSALSSESLLLSCLHSPSLYFFLYNE